MTVAGRRVRVVRRATSLEARSEPSRRVALILAACGVVALSALLHVAHLGATPGWDAQEGYNLDIAWNLLHGNLRLFALSSAFAQHPPLFYLQLSLAIRVFGYNIVAVRALAACYAVVTGIALLGIGRRLLGTGAALWAGVVYAGAPIMLANTRWGYTYSQLAFVGVLCLWAAWRYHEGGAWRWLIFAAALAGLATFSDYEGVGWVLFVAMLALRGGWKRIAAALSVGLAVPIVGLLACYLASPGVFSADFGATFLRATGGNIIVQLIELLVNYFRFVSLDAWTLLGLVGFFLAPARVRGFLFAALATVGLVALKVRDLGLSIHTAVPLLPLLALGAGLALHLALRRLYGWTLAWLTPALSRRPFPGFFVMRRYTGRFAWWGGSSSAPAKDRLGAPAQPRLARFLAATVVFLVIVSPLGIAIASDLSGAIPTRQDSVLATPADAQATIHYVLSHARPGDLVLASPALAWRFDHPSDAVSLQAADILQSVAQSGDAVAFYPAHLPDSRWAYDVLLPHARFVIVDDLTRQLAVPGQADALIPILKQVQSWPAVYTVGQYTVYERPGSA